MYDILHLSTYAFYIYMCIYTCTCMHVRRRSRAPRQHLAPRPEFGSSSRVPYFVVRRLYPEVNRHGSRKEPVVRIVPRGPSGTGGHVGIHSFSWVAVRELQSR